MKKRIASFFVFSIILMAAFCADIPKWMKNPDLEYPETEYIKAIGEGSSAQLAKNNALAEIALFFDTKVNVLKLSVEELRSVDSGENSAFITNELHQQVAKISSEAEFLCVKFTESYYDKKSKKYTVLSYINKNDAYPLYKSRIDALMNSIDSYCEHANQEKEPFLSVVSLKKAQRLGVLAERYIRAIMTIEPSDVGLFKPSLQKITLIQNKIDELKPKMTFSIALLQNDKRYDQIFSTAAEILEKEGDAYSLKNSKYKIAIDITCLEEQNDAGDFIRPSINILIVNNEGTGVYTYSKAYSKIGSKSMEQAYIRTVSKIKQDLQENFLSE